MSYETELPECQWRQIDNHHISCGLVRAITGLSAAGVSSIDRDVCRNCNQWFVPSQEQFNPVVASLIYQISVQVQQAGGLPGFSTTQASELKAKALKAIPHDFDAGPISEQVESQLNIELGDIGLLIPRPSRRTVYCVRKWAVAVTTAPRQQMTFDRCLSSIRAAGWQEPRVIADGEVEIPAQWVHLPITRRLPQIGAWPSYYLTLIEMLMRQPEADAFLIVQDDVVLFENPSLRSYLESMLWPGDKPGIVSLFCSRAYHSQKPGWYQLEEPLTWGGQALIFAREIVIRLISDVRITMHRYAENGKGLANIDGLIGAWAFDTGTPVYVSSPSLSQHIGHVSSLWKDTAAFVNRSATSFAGATNRSSQC